MNTVAYAENLANKRYIRKTNTGGLVIDTSKVTYHGIPWVALSNHEKRKCENMLVFSYPNEVLHPVYE